MGTSDRTINNLNRHLLKKFDAALIESVHPNSSHQIPEIREQLLKSIAVEPKKLQSMKDLVKATAIKSLITMLSLAKSSSDYLKFLSCLTGDFTRFFCVSTSE